jgi:hypothetical protein
MPAVYLHISGEDVEGKILAAHGIIKREEKKAREEELKPVECPRCKTKNPVGAKYCFTCSMILDQKLAVETQSVKNEIGGQVDGAMMAELLDLVKRFSEKQT